MNDTIQIPDNANTAMRLMWPFLAGKDIQKTIHERPTGKHRNGQLTRRQHERNFRY